LQQIKINLLSVFMTFYEFAKQGQNLNPRTLHYRYGFQEIYLLKKFKYADTAFPPLFLIYKFNSK